MKNLKKILGLSLAVLLSVSMLAGCGDKKEDVSKEPEMLQQIKDKGELVVGTSAEYPPYEFHAMVDGKDTVVGYDILIADAIAKDLGVKLKIQEMDFDALIAALQGGKIDMILAGMSPTPERKKSVDFSEVYYKGKNAIVICKGEDSKLKSIDDLKKMKIGVQKGSIQETYVNTELQAPNVTSLAGVPDLILELKNKNIDAVVVNDAVGLINAGKYDGIKLADLKIGGEDESESMAAAIKKGNNKTYIEAVNKVLDNLKKEGKLDQFLKESSELAAKSGTN